VLLGAVAGAGAPPEIPWLLGPVAETDGTAAPETALLGAPNEPELESTLGPPGIAPTAVDWICGWFDGGL